ncbi:MAG: hypothetical protein HY595_04055 [Candidatus Omnitrophica bacterium]|nr:hypothetical protein [Candidatus Omnitrophota bacterium]
MIGGISLIVFGGWGLYRFMVPGAGSQPPGQMGNYWYFFVAGLLVSGAGWGFWLRKPWARIALIVIYALGLISKIRPDFPLTLYFHFLYLTVRLGSFEVDILNVCLYAYLLYFLTRPAVKAQFQASQAISVTHDS